MVISEWKSVNEEVVRNTDEIFEKIISDSKNKTPSIGIISNIPFKKGSFVHNCNDTIGKISVVYCVFQPDNKHDCERLSDSGFINCYTDTEAKIMVINTCFVNGEENVSLKQSIAHELNHLLQYTMGSKKNDDLYSKMSDIIKDSGLPKKERLPAYLLYYTFAHEIDSFAAQFYFFLKEKKVDCNSGFDNIISEYKPYTSANFLYSNAMKLLNDEQLKKGIKRLGFSDKQWRHRIQSGFKRLKNRLHNVFYRYAVESQRETLVLEGFIGRFSSLYSRYGFFDEEMEPLFEI